MKKTIRFITVLLILTSTLFSSCSSDDNGESFGTSTGNYFPLSIGNNWKYFDISQSLITEMEITGTTSFSGQTYYQYIDDSDTFVMTHWFAKKGATYFIKSGDTTFNQDGLDITIKSYELPILKDDYAVNDSWTGRVSPKVTFSGNGTSGTLPFKVDYTGINYFKGELLLNGTTYPNVIKTRITISINANDQITNSSEEYWYAENIGIIKFITTNSDNSIDEKDINSYTIN
ncbi:hypothetical protein [Flavobacterium sp.]|jgi:hypothetical protein|uniref:hypothetical protein n=1 Tax=Flavobacterium sp. TaxID=239 RepID=UPI0037532E38